jgi:hypothetical protein
MNKQTLPIIKLSKDMAKKLVAIPIIAVIIKNFIFKKLYLL